jgi:hypothetical protein
MAALGDRCRGLTHGHFTLSEAALCAIQPLLHASANTLQSLTVEPADGEGEGEEAPDEPHDDGGDWDDQTPIVLRHLTHLEMCDDAWTSALCRLLSCPHLATVRVRLCKGTRVSELLSNLPMCQRLSLCVADEWEPVGSVADAPSAPMPATVSHLKLEYGVPDSRAVKELLRCFTRLSSIVISIQRNTRHDIVQFLGTLCDCRPAAATLTALTIRAPAKQIRVDGHDPWAAGHEQEAKSGLRATLLALVSVLPNLTLFDVATFTSYQL